MIVGLNPQGDTVSVMDNLSLNYSYWECDCSYDHIRPVKLHHCNECGSDREDSLIAYETEVQQFIYRSII